MFYALAFLDCGRFPSEVMALPRGERAFLRAAIEFRNEAAHGPKQSGEARAARADLEYAAEKNPRAKGQPNGT